MNKPTNVNLKQYDWLVLNSSGGKDSQTLLEVMVKMAREQSFPMDRIIVVHADLGRVEWAGTLALAEAQAKFYGLRFESMSRPQGDLLDQIEKRGMFPSSTTRYCTSDHKRDQIGKVFPRLQKESGLVQTNILNCMGLRAQESPARAKKEEFEVNTRQSTKTRTVTNFHPILFWTEDEVWESIRETGVPSHEAYQMGMGRLSCVFCVFAPKSMLMIAGKNNPELLDEYVRVERKIGHTFTAKFSIESIRDAIVAGETANAADDTPWSM